MYQFLVSLLSPFPLLYLLAGLMLVSLWRKRIATPRRLWLITAVFLVLTVLFMPAVAFLALGSLEWRYPPCYAKPDNVQAIVVLSGFAYPPDEVRRQPELAADTLYRCLYAAELYHHGKPCPVVLSGGKFSLRATGLTLAQVMHDFLLTQGISRADLVLEHTSQNTYENAVNTKALLAGRGVRRIVLVTDAAHLPRAVRCFQAEGFDVVPAGCRYRACGFEWSLSEFLPNPDAGQGVAEVLHEWVGILWYWLRYGV